MQNLDNLSPEEIGKLFPVTVVPYNSNWKAIYEEEKELLLATLGKSLVATVEHIGSTSVEGLSAKPTIDIMIEVEKLRI